MHSSVRQLVFVRHGITAPQEQRRYCGHLDPELSLLGKEQVERAREKFLHLQPACVWSSDLRRCTETASMLCPGMAYTTLPEFREISFGNFENRCYSEFSSEINNILLDSDTCFPGGESLRDLSSRVRIGLTKVLAHSSETVVVVAHAGSIAAAALVLLDLPLGSFWSFQLPHGGSAVFEGGKENWVEASADWKRPED
ncbi:MAG TPA: histidine phosphatase family protein [Candidatus Angelobacter sp.]|nr:histidine phosphatase family protein [Candidatus Angelobacter sp.]